MGERATRRAARRRVLILGGGFAGLGAARTLKDAEVDVVVVDRHDYHTFQPLLYQVASDLLAPASVGHPLRDLFHEQPNARVHKASVTRHIMSTFARTHGRVVGHATRAAAPKKLEYG